MTRKNSLLGRRPRFTDGTKQVQHRLTPWGMAWLQAKTAKAGFTSAAEWINTEGEKLKAKMTGGNKS